MKSLSSPIELLCRVSVQRRSPAKGFHLFENRCNGGPRRHPFFLSRRQSRICPRSGSRIDSFAARCSLRVERKPYPCAAFREWRVMLDGFTHSHRGRFHVKRFRRFVLAGAPAPLLLKQRFDGPLANWRSPRHPLSNACASPIRPPPSTTQNTSALNL